MNPGYPQWPGFRLPFGTPAPKPAPPVAPPAVPADEIPVEEIPDHHSQLEELLGHVRRCERWARLDDRIDLSWRLGGTS
jgi:hypothetical protein